MAVARWLRGRTKLAAVLGLIKDQTAAGIARASGPFSHLHLAIVNATNHQESLPGENYVEEILAAGTGPRMQVSFCTSLLVKRLKKTQSWPVALKCLVILHRSIVDGGFLFQDLLTYSALREGNDYISFSRCKQAAVDWEYCFYVRSYAKYLDERLRCAHALKTHLDHRWKSEVTERRAEFMETEELLYQLEALQNLLHELYQCEPAGDIGENPVIQGTLVLVVMDSYKLVDEIRFRIKEMLERINTLPLSVSLAVLYNCKRADIQMQTLQTFLEHCKEFRLLADIPMPRKAMVTKLEIQKLTEAIQSLQKEPTTPSFTRSVSTGGKVLAGNLPPKGPARQPLRIEGPGNLQRTSSQPMSNLPRRPPGGTTREFSYIPEELPYARHSSADLIDLSLDSDESNRVEKHRASQSTFQDLITF